MRSVRWLDLLQGISRYALYAVIVLGGISASYCLAGNLSFEYPGVEVDSISYQGNNNYKVDITVYNRTAETITLKEQRASFYVQTEVLGQWKELSASAQGAIGSLLPPRKGMRTVYILKIPAESQALFRNSEGDINMVFRYLIRFVAGSGSGLRTISGESACWITPKTDRWVLREGM